MEDNYEIVDDDLIVGNHVSNMVLIENQLIPTDRLSNKNDVSSMCSSANVSASKSYSIKKLNTVNPNEKKGTVGTILVTDNNLPVTSGSILLATLQKSDGKNISTIAKQKTMPNRKSTNVDNSISFGERLYRKSLALKERKTLVMNEVKVQKDAEFKKQCSFKPKLNKDSCLMSLKVTK
jgi:hypothetical protein